MNAENFVYWLQGALELGATELNSTQVQVIKDHIALVLHKETPTRKHIVVDVLKEKQISPRLLDENRDIFTQYPSSC